MNKHIIYIPNTGQEYILSQQLAQAFARHNYDKVDEECPIIIAQYGSNLKPLELVTPKDTLQIMFTPISNLYAPMHTQTTSEDLRAQIPMLIDHLVQDGLNPNGCNIQLYTLENSDQDTVILKTIADKLIADAHFLNFSLEWHVIPKLRNLSHEQLSRIFQPQITCQATVHAVTDKQGKTKLIETSGLQLNSDKLH